MLKPLPNNSFKPNPHRGTAWVLFRYASTQSPPRYRVGLTQALCSREIAIKTISLVLSFAVLLLISSALGFLGKPTEMGLAIIAGALGLAFSNIDKLARFKGAGFEAEMKMVEAIIESQTEPSSEQKEEAKRADAITDAENLVLKSLQKPGYTWRYAKTVAGEVSRPTLEIESTLASLMNRGLAKKAKGSNGEIWAATAVGKSVQEQHDLKAR